MNKEVICVSPESKIDEIARLLAENRIHGVPVAESGKLVGMVVEDDFFTKGAVNIHLPSYIDFLKKTKVEKTVDGPQRKDIDNLYETTARDIMTADCVKLNPEMDAHEILQKFKETRHKTYPVVDGENNLVGIITIADVLNLF